MAEAALSAVVIAVGLVFINRGLSNQLRAIRSVEDYEIPLALARSWLLEQEGQLLFQLGQEVPRSGAFEAPDEDHVWAVTAAARGDVLDAGGASAASDVILQVRRTAGASSAVRIGAIWRRDWVTP